MEKQTIKTMIRRAANRQVVSLDGVVPFHKFVNGIFYLDSPAGSLSVKFNRYDIKSITKFRDRFVNKFTVAIFPNDFFKIYSEIMSQPNRKYIIRYKANLRTRLKGRLCRLKELF